MKFDIKNDDVLEVLVDLDDCSFDACFCDPPYALKFMGARWDYDLPTVEVWREVWRILKPGAHLFAYGSTKTVHRLACRIEDAGFHIRDSIGYLYGQGWPKGANVSKSLDAHLGAEREVVGESRYAARQTPSNKNTYGSLGKGGELTAPATDIAAKFDGYHTELKPAIEPVVVAMKPLDGTYAENAIKWGVAGLNIDGTRIGDEPRTNDRASYNASREGMPDDAEPTECEGRFPANIVLDSIAARMLDEQSGPAGESDSVARGTFNGVDRTPYHGGEGGASRFFYTAKASPNERDAGLLAGDLDKNDHPTVKPVDLNRWLATMLLPPARDDDPRRLLMPYSGVGSEMIGAMFAGWDYALGIEFNPSYIDIARRRLAWWREHGDQAVEVYKAAKKRREREAETGQANMFD